MSKFDNDNNDKSQIVNENIEKTVSETPSNEGKINAWLFTYCYSSYTLNMV